VSPLRNESEAERERSLNFVGEIFRSVGSAGVGRVDAEDAADELEDELDDAAVTNGMGGNGLLKDGRGETMTNCGSFDTDLRPISKTS